MIKVEPAYQVQNGGKLVVIKIVVISASKPTCNWMFGAKSIATTGRFKQEIVKEGDGYAITLKVDQVGLVTLL